MKKRSSFKAVLVAGLVVVSSSQAVFASTQSASNLGLDKSDGKALEMDPPLKDSSSWAELDERMKEDASAPNEYEFSAAAEYPNGFSPSSRLTDVGGFSSTALPTFGLETYRPTGRSLFSTPLTLKLGVSFSVLNRSALVTGAGVANLTSSQNLYLLPLNVGLEIRPSSLSYKSFHTYFGVAAVPMIGLTDREAFDDGATLLGIGGQVSVGATAKITNGLSLDLGLNAMTGVLGGSRLTEEGVLVGLRFFM
jgi:hypothetical protein